MHIGTQLYIVENIRGTQTFGVMLCRIENGNSVLNTRIVHC